MSLTYPFAEDRDPTVWRITSALAAKEIELTAPLIIECRQPCDQSEAAPRLVTTYQL